MRTFLNIPMQANGSELMRLVIIHAGASGLRLIGCAHDSFLIEDTVEDIEGSVRKLQEIMRKASHDLLGGFELRADCKPGRDIVRYPDRFIDKRELEDGMSHWNRLMALITEETEDGRFADQRRASAGTATTGQDGKEEEQAACLQARVGQVASAVG
jgi:hypothetical protein